MTLSKSTMVDKGCNVKKYDLMFHTSAFVVASFISFVWIIESKAEMLTLNFIRDDQLTQSIFFFLAGCLQLFTAAMIIPMILSNFIILVVTFFFIRKELKKIESLGMKSQEVVKKETQVCKKFFIFLINKANISKIVNRRIVKVLRSCYFDRFWSSSILHSDEHQQYPQNSILWQQNRKFNSEPNSRIHDLYLQFPNPSTCPPAVHFHAF